VTSRAGFSASATHRPWQSAPSRQILPPSLVRQLHDGVCEMPCFPQIPRQARHPSSVPGGVLGGGAAAGAAAAAADDEVATGGPAAPEPRHPASASTAITIVSERIDRMAVSYPRQRVSRRTASPEKGGVKLWLPAVRVMAPVPATVPAVGLYHS
jgi:hypothetical protein